jgi:hypothetical protein
LVCCTKKNLATLITYAEWMGLFEDGSLSNENKGLLPSWIKVSWLKKWVAVKMSRRELITNNYEIITYICTQWSASL